MARTFAKFKAALRQRESGGDYKVENQLGYLGAYQFGELALIDLGYYRRDGTAKNDWKPKFFTGKDGIGSKSDFLNSRSVQDAAADDWFSLLWRYVRARDLEFYDKQVLNGVELTVSGMIAASHLVGTGGLRTFIKSGGTTIPKDGNGVGIDEYLKLFTGYSTPASFRTNHENDNEIFGGSGADSLKGFGGNDVLTGRGGKDVLNGGVGDDRLIGGYGADNLKGGAGNDILDGGAGADVMRGDAGNDVLTGRAGNDAMAGGDGKDRMNGGNGADKLYGGNHNDRLVGGAGKDLLKGGGGRDILDGGAGDDTLDGGAGNDRLLGGRGDDVFIGGSGADTFVFGAVPPKGGSATFRDITGADKIDVTALGIRGIVVDEDIDFTDSVPEPDGLFLIAGTVDVILDGAGGATERLSILDVLETDGDWLLVSSNRGQYQVIADLYGAIEEDNFLI